MAYMDYIDPASDVWERLLIIITHLAAVGFKLPGSLH